jgi:hypothetical protein
MLLILPLATFLVFYLILREKGVDWRRSYLASAIFWGTSVVVITETLSVPRLITRNCVAAFWLTICVLGALYLLRSRMPTEPRAVSQDSNEPSATSLDSATRALLVATGALVLLVLIVAVMAAPSTWDAMEYHLPRVVLWMSNHSVRFYPTPDYAQLVYAPWAEYAMMHVDLLWGSDRFVNLVDLFSLIGTAIAVSLCAKKLGAGNRAQALAGIISAAIPEGVLEASGPMNTYVVAFWITTTVAFLLSWDDDPNWFNTLCVALAAGLAILTKGTTYIYLPFLVLAGWCMGSRYTRILFLKRSAAFLAPILALNAPQFIRCWRFMGSPLGMPLPFKYPRLEVSIVDISVRETLANILRNVSLHLSTPFSALNARTETLLRLAMHAIGVNPDNPNAIVFGEQFSVNKFSINEIHSGDPAHLVCLVLAIVLILWHWRSPGLRRALLYACGIFAAFVFFCAMLRWNQWASRYHLALFALGSALIALVLEKYFSPRVATAVTALFVAYALVFAATNRTRSLIRWHLVEDVYQPRPVLYFNDSHKYMADANIQAANAVNHLDCAHVGIDSYTDLPDYAIGHSPESLYVYPMLALIHADGRNRSVSYVGVNNLTSRFADASNQPRPCAVICLQCANVPSKMKQYGDRFQHSSIFDYIVVFDLPVSNLNSSARLAK